LKNNKIIYLIIATLILTPITATVTTSNPIDYDPLVNIKVTVEINSIRALEKLDELSEADFYVKITINEEEYTSPTYLNSDYLYNLPWTFTVDVPDGDLEVDIKIQLWDQDNPTDTLCDISPNQYDNMINIVYNIKTGHWSGDDSLEDPSGYGRANGCDDESYYTNEQDCELWFKWFNIYQTDYDNDGIPYDIEVNTYNTNPKKDNRGEDTDDDGCPIEWEHKWGYNPKVFDDHNTTDTDLDGLDNIEEYLTSQWDSDPYRKDLFLELDQMEDGPNGEQNTVPDPSKEMLKTGYDYRNIMFHLDDGWMGGGELIPFEEMVYAPGEQDIYREYFLHNDTDNWRQGVFHYGLMVYDHFPIKGFAFSGGNNWRTNSFLMSSSHLAKKEKHLNKEKNTIYAGVIMHEIGHSLGIYSGNPPGCDNQRGRMPLQLQWWLYGNYKSCMNYRYVYKLVDYSDGSHGFLDFDDWSYIDFTLFQK